MIVFQAPAGMPEHDRLANQIGNYFEPHLSRELVVLYDPYCYTTHEMLERLGVKEYFVFETARRAGKVIRVYRLEPKGGAFAQYQEIPLDGATVRSEVLGVELPVAWMV
jgi:hypothetical protein